jgi:pimeloyl-ACP methyl ester carboxylesterase
MAAEFTVCVPQAEIDAILARVRGFPWFPEPVDEGGSWGRGVNTGYLRELCAYWAERYDWRAQERELNRYPQFVEVIDGLKIHFVHLVGEAEGRRPLVLTHGWPGSHFEFWAAIERLAYPSRFGGSSTDAFDVVVPSLPGYGFSGKPDKPFGQRATARVWDKLMTRTLDYPRYIAQGGDWGSLVTTFLGLEHPSCVGIHLNLIPIDPLTVQPMSEEEAEWLAQASASLAAEGAYFHQQATKPQTLSMALMDSPVGAAAWILEKFHGWSDLRQGGLESVYTKDQLLTNIMIYLVKDTIATSVWYYRAFHEEGNRFGPGAGERVLAPTGVASFAGEPVFKTPPRSMVKRAYNVAQWADLASGGHFAAMERPDAFVRSVREFAAAIGY